MTVEQTITKGERIPFRFVFCRGADFCKPKIPIVNITMVNVGVVSGTKLFVPYTDKIHATLPTAVCSILRPVMEHKLSRVAIMRDFELVVSPVRQGVHHLSNKPDTERAYGFIILQNIFFFLNIGYSMEQYHVRVL